jgi:hypothetical protein
MVNFARPHPKPNVISQVTPMVFGAKYAETLQKHFSAHSGHHTYPLRTASLASS